jgi:hypothetical protein
MRKGIAILLACLAATLILAATATAAITRLDLGATADLGPEGAFVLVPVTYQCDFQDTRIFINVRVTQSRGNRFADGSGFAQGDCSSGRPQTLLVQVDSFSGVPYHHGSAVATASASTFISQSSDGPEEIRITR